MCKAMNFEPANEKVVWANMGLMVCQIATHTDKSVINAGPLSVKMCKVWTISNKLLRSKRLKSALVLYDQH